MDAWLGVAWPAYLAIGGVLMGAAAYATGRAVANTWRPLWQAAFYCFLLSLGTRFLLYALFDGALLSASGFAIDLAWLTAVGIVGFRTTRVRKVVTQYPWLYERAGPWRFRRRA